MIVGNPPSGCRSPKRPPSSAGNGSPRKLLGFFEVLDAGSSNNKECDGVCSAAQTAASAVGTSLKAASSQSGRVSSRKSSRSSTPSDCCLIVLPPEAPVISRPASGELVKGPTAEHALPPTLARAHENRRVVSGCESDTGRAQVLAERPDSELSYGEQSAKEELKLISLDEAFQEVVAAMKYEELTGQAEGDRSITVAEEIHKDVLHHIEQLRCRSGSMELASEGNSSHERPAPGTELVIRAKPDHEDSAGSGSQPRQAELELKIIKGLEKIRMLDAVLREKSQIARSLTHRRESRPQTENEPSARCSPPDGCSEIDFRSATPLSCSTETTSCSAGGRATHGLGPHPDSRTFITETRVSKKRLQRLRRKSGDLSNPSDNPEERKDLIDDDIKPAREEGPVTRGFKKGDFVRRNIVLGKEARYYSAMTEEEQVRVELLMSTETDGEEKAASASETQSLVGAATTSGSSARARLLVNGYVPDGDDRTRLEEIDSKLAELVMSGEEVLSIIERFKARKQQEGTGDESPQPAAAATAAATAQAP